jgi:hypothetical protein
LLINQHVGLPAAITSIGANHCIDC